MEKLLHSKETLRSGKSPRKKRVKPETASPVFANSSNEARSGEILDLLELALKDSFQWKAAPVFSYFGQLDTLAEQRALYIIACLEQESEHLDLSVIDVEAARISLGKEIRIKIRVSKSSKKRALDLALAYRQKSKWLKIAFSQKEGVMSFSIKEQSRRSSAAESNLNKNVTISKVARYDN